MHNLQMSTLTSDALGPVSVYAISHTISRNKIIISRQMGVNTLPGGGFDAAKFRWLGENNNIHRLQVNAYKHTQT